MTKILIVDDDVMLRGLYAKIFLFEKFEVVTAGDGEEGLAKAESESPTLVMTDLMMPKMNGLQLLEKLKSNDKTKSIPVIMLTSLDEQQDAETALTKGAIKYIIKSEYEPKQVADMVKEVLANYTNSEVPGTITPAAEVSTP